VIGAAWGTVLIGQFAHGYTVIALENEGTSKGSEKQALTGTQMATGA
jgi:hypothetical protein